MKKKILKRHCDITIMNLETKLGNWKTNHSKHRRWKWLADEKNIYQTRTDNKNIKHEIIKKEQRMLIGSIHTQEQQEIPKEAVPTTYITTNLISR